MKETLIAATQGYQIYEARRNKYKTNEVIPFRVSPQPLELSISQKQELLSLGNAIVSFVNSSEELYHSHEDVKKLLDKGKPEIFLANQPSHYLFVRPDLIITPEGFSICEIETSPFGLALAEMLNHAYQSENFETLISDGTLGNYVSENTPIEGTIVYSQKTKSYAGQISFLADQVFSNQNRSWQAKSAEELELPVDNYYRAFYLAEYLNNDKVKNLIHQTNSGNAQSLPTLTPFLEEKALMSLFWDKRFRDFFAQQLGHADFNLLTKMIPPTWIIGQEQYFAPGLPKNLNSTLDLANLSKSQRTFVVKNSGFSQASSWSEGVNFLHQLSQQKSREILQAASLDTDALYIVQEFKKGQKIPFNYETATGLNEMTARVRLTPYFATQGKEQGKLIALKATGCENTDFIHTSTTSINAAVS